MPALVNENQSFQDTNGKPIVNGFIYVGLQNSNAKDNKIAIFPTRALTLPELANPQRTDASGRSINKIWVPGRHSIFVDDENGVQKLRDDDAGEEPSIGITSLTNVQIQTNAIIGDAVPTITAYVDKQEFSLTLPSSPTGSATLSVDGLAAVTIKNKGLDLVAAQLPANRIVVVVFNIIGPIFELINPFSKAITAFTPFTSSGTWTRNSQTQSAWIFCVGAGAGGAGTQTGGTSGGGGGAGGLSIAFVTLFTGGTDAVLIGAGGGGGAVNGAGGPGGVVSVGTLCKANGGSGAAIGSGTGGTGATITGAIGDIKLRGASGSPGTSKDTTNNHSGGTGGGSFLGSGGVGGTGGGGVGIAALVEGSGGGGGGGTNTIGGGAGKSGLVFILEFG